MLATPAIYLSRETPKSGGSVAEAPAATEPEHQRPLTGVRGPLAGGSSARETRARAGLARFNPLTVPIEFFRAATLGTPVAAGSVLVSFVINAAICLVGLYYFRHVEDSFADVI